LIAPVRCQTPGRANVARHKQVAVWILAGIVASLPANAQTVGIGGPGTVTAIDILLEPDATMVKNAEDANERLLKEIPKGFALDKTHHPHTSCLQRYVRTEDFNEVYETVAKVLAEEKPTTWKLKAYKYYYISWKEIGLAGIVIEPTVELIRYQQKLIDGCSGHRGQRGAQAARWRMAGVIDCDRRCLPNPPTRLPPLLPLQVILEVQARSSPSALPIAALGSVSRYFSPCSHPPSVISPILRAERL
jgi:hypothetical protein